MRTRTGLRRTDRTAARRRRADPPALGCPQTTACFLEQAVAGLAIGLILVEPRGRVVWLNRSAEQLLDIPTDLCVGRSLREVLQDPRLAAFWSDVACREGNCMADISVTHPRRLELKLHATVCRSAQGREIGRALLFCDVTSERNVSVELTREMAARLLDLADPRGAAPRKLASLTAQQLRALRLLGQGQTNDAIAAAMGVAPSTIRSHLKQAYRKLGLATRAEAVSFAARQRLT